MTFLRLDLGLQETRGAVALRERGAPPPQRTCGRWRIEAPIEKASGLPSKDLGYPCTLPRRDGTLVTLFYARDSEGVTCLRARIWRLS